MQKPPPRTYKERLFAQEDPSRVPDRVTRGQRRVHYRQLAKDINQFETLVPVPPTPSRLAEIADSSSYGAAASVRSSTPTRDRTEEDDGGWGPTPTATPRPYLRPGQSDNGWTNFHQGSTSRSTRTPAPSSTADFWVTATPSQVPQTQPRLGRGGAAHRFIASHLGRQFRPSRTAIPFATAQLGLEPSITPSSQASTSTRAFPELAATIGPESTIDPHEELRRWYSGPSSPAHTPQNKPSRPDTATPALSTVKDTQTPALQSIPAQTPGHLTAKPASGSTHRHSDPGATPNPSHLSQPSIPSSSFSTPSAIPPHRTASPVPRMSRSNLGRSPSVMRDRTQFDGVLGRIRNARSQLIEGDGSSPPSMRLAENSGRVGRSDERVDGRSQEIELLKKENQEYKRDTERLRVELDGLLSDMEKARSTDHEAALRRAKRQLKEKNDALKEAEAALLKASEPRSRYRSTTPSPSRAPPARNLVVPHQVEELEDQISSLKSEITNLRSSLEASEKRFKEECRLHKLTRSEATGAKEHQSQMAKAKNELEGCIARLEGKLDIEARSKVAAIERLRALENGNHSLMGMNKEIGILRNQLAHAELQTANANEKLRDMTKKKQDIEDKCKTLRIENDALDARVKEMSSQVKGEEKYLKDKERLQHDIRDVNKTIDRLRLERSGLKQSLATARNVSFPELIHALTRKYKEHEKQSIQRQLEIRDQAMEKLHGSREKKKLRTLASEISMDPLRPSSSHATSSRNSEASTTNDEPPNPPVRPVSPKQTFVERRYKLKTPLVPARLGSPEPQPPAPLASVLEQPNVSAISSDAAGSSSDNPSIISNTAKPNDQLGSTPPCEASIGFDTPSPAIYVIQPSEPSQTAQLNDRGRSAEPDPTRKGDVFDDELMVISDTIWSGSDSAMSIDGEEKPKKRDYVEDMRVLDYDPFAGIDETFGLGGPMNERKKSKTPPHIAYERKERERGKDGSGGSGSQAD